MVFDFYTKPSEIGFDACLTFLNIKANLVSFLFQNFKASSFCVIEFVTKWESIRWCISTLRALSFKKVKLMEIRRLKSEWDLGNLTEGSGSIQEDQV